MIEKIGHYSLENPGSVYDEEAMTALELAGRTAQKVNECVDQVNKTTEEIPGMIDDTIQGLMDDGTFDEYIDEHQQNILDSVGKYQQQTNEAVTNNLLTMQSQMMNKLDKGSTGSISMAMLGQDVKTAMTGGSVAVVGVDAVGHSNIIDGQVYPKKLATSISDWYCVNTDMYTPFIKLNAEDKTAEINRTDKLRIITGYDYFDLDFSTATVDTSKWSTSSTMLWYERANNTFHVTNALNYYYDWMLVGYWVYKDCCFARIPFSMGGAVVTPHELQVGQLALGFLRFFNNNETRIMPYVDFKNRNLVIPQHCILYALVGRGLGTIVNTETEPLYVPFKDGEHQYLVANDGELLFVSASEYLNNRRWRQYQYVLGYVNTVRNAINLTFPCAKGRSISILGDSISTFKDYSHQGSVYYNGGDHDVPNVHHTWWHRAMDNLGLVLNVNNSQGGSTVSNFKDADHRSGMQGALELDNGTPPDIIVVYMGINDFNSGVPLGNYRGKGTLPTNGSTFREAYAIMLHNMLVKYPTTKIYACTLPPCQRTANDIDSPESNKVGIYLTEYNDAIRELCNAFNVDIIELARCGLTNYNAETYMADYATDTGLFLHPNSAGHGRIAEKVIQTIGKE